MEEKDKAPGPDNAKRILQGVEKDSHGVYTGALHKLGKMTGLSAGDDVSQSDPAEKWGRIVGRTLGFGFLALLVINLFTRWFF